MTQQGEGFQTNVGELEKIATIWLPNAAAALRVPVAVLSDHTRTERPQEVPAVSAAERAYGLLTERLAGRLKRGAELVDETAVSLLEIATLYRRVDGQG